MQLSPALKVTVFWGDIVYDTLLMNRSKAITIGRKLGNTYILDLDPDSPYEHLEVIRYSKKGRTPSAVLRFDDSVVGHVRLGGGKQVSSLQAIKNSPQVKKNEKGFYELTLNPKDKADVVFGHVTFYLDWIHERPILIPKSPEKKDKFILFGLPIGLSFFALVIWLVTLLPEEEPEKPPERLVTIMQKNVPTKAAVGEYKTADGGAQKGDAGKAELNKAVTEKPSVAASLRKANLGSVLSGLSNLGSTAPKADSSQRAVISAIEQAGTGGFTTQGIKQGAGGKSVGIGRTVGQGEGGFQGTGRLGLSGNSLVEGGSGRGETVTEGGGLDREVIESIIRRRQDRIRLCYERQLNFNPRLSGKVSVHFVIGKTGNVLASEISEDTMKSAPVNRCILSEVKTWTFPAPQGGTIVNVNYPFAFESSARAK